MHAAISRQEPTMQTDDYRCTACRFYEQWGAPDDGWCKRYAPRPTFTPDHQEWTVAWPRVTGDNWCGEWVSAEDGPA